MEIPPQLTQIIEKVTARVEILKGILERLKEYKCNDHYLIPTCEKLTFDHQILTLWERVKKVKRHPFIEACNQIPHLIFSNGDEGLFYGADFDEISKFIENVTKMFKPEFATLYLEALHNGLEECLVQIGMIEQQVVDSRIGYEPIAHLLPLFGESINEMRSGIESAGYRTLQMNPLNADAPIELQITFNMSCVAKVLPFLMQSFCVNDQEAKNGPQSMKIADESHPFYTIVKCRTGVSGESVVWVHGNNFLCLSGMIASPRPGFVKTLKLEFGIENVRIFTVALYQCRRGSVNWLAKDVFWEHPFEAVTPMNFGPVTTSPTQMDFNPVCTNPKAGE